LFIISGPV